MNTKKELEYFLLCDKIALGRHGKRPKLFGDEIWKFQIYMRKLEYYSNCSGLFVFPMRLYYRYKYHQLSVKLGFSIPHNNIGPGLAIVHYGTIVISSASKIGANCRIHAGVNIGVNGGEHKAAQIGDNVYIGPGAKIIGGVVVGDNSVIGANAVVVNDVPQSVTVGGVPAKVISQNDSSRHLIKATDMAKRG